MKYRHSFVSNSSSASFMINLDRLSQEQRDIVLSYGEDVTDYKSGHQKKYGEYGCDAWNLTVDDQAGFIEGWTIMDNGSLASYLDYHGISGYRIIGE